MASHKAKAALEKARRAQGGSQQLVEPPRRVVTSRTSIAEPDLIASFKISKGMKFDLGGGVDNKAYALKKLNVKGGRICVHVYGEALHSRVGTCVAGKVVLMRKTYDDGSDEVYADFFEVKGANATHTLNIYSNDREYRGNPQDAALLEPILTGVLVIEPVPAPASVAA